LVLGTQSGLQELGPDLGFGAQGGLWDLGLRSLLISWPSYEVQVLGPKTDCRSPLWHLGSGTQKPPYLRTFCAQL
jgi:hypothetical protein